MGETAAEREFLTLHSSLTVENIMQKNIGFLVQRCLFIKYFFNNLWIKIQNKIMNIKSL